MVDIAAALARSASQQKGDPSRLAGDPSRQEGDPSWGPGHPSWRGGHPSSRPGHPSWQGGHPSWRGGQRQRARRAPAALTLVEASFDSGGPVAFLEFDRAIDISSMDPTEIQVGDGVNTLYRYIGSPGGASLANPTTLRLEMTIFGADADGQLTLTATTATGIVAADDGGMWSGVEALPLPFGA